MKKNTSRKSKSHLPTAEQEIINREHAHQRILLEQVIHKVKILCTLSDIATNTSASNYVST